MARSRRADQRGGAGVRRRAVAAWAGLGLVLLLIFTGFVLRQAENAVRSEAEGRVRVTAELTAQLAAEQSRRFAEVTGAYARRLRGLSPPRQAQVSPTELALVRRTLAGLRQQVEGSDAVEFTDRLGRVVASAASRPTTPGTDRSGTDWYRGVRATGGTYLSRADEFLGAPSTTVAVPVLGPGPARPRIGVVAATVVDRFAELVNRADEDMTLTLTDQAGTVVSRTYRPPGRLITVKGDPLVAAALAGRSGVRLRDLDGRPTVSGFAPVPGTGWTVVADVPAARAFADVTRLRITLLTGAAIVAFLLLWLLPLLALRLGRARERIDVSERFQADLLPSDLPPGVTTHYVASEKRMLLGGDFLDAVRTPDGGLALLVGDVCGHGPRAAALAARLRASWRTLATAGSPLERLDVLDRIVVSERHDEDMFATMVVAHVDAAGESIRWALAGHPPALLDVDGRVEVLDDEGRGPALGLVTGVPWPVAERELPLRWTLVLYTDGLIEARGQAGGERLEVVGLQALVEASRGVGGISAEALVRSVARVADGDGRGLDDDLALLVVEGAVTRRQLSDNAVHGAHGG